MFEFANRKALEDAADAVSSLLDTSWDFSVLVAIVSNLYDEIVEEDALWDLREFTSKDDCGRSALRRVPGPHPAQGFLVQLYFRSVQKINKDALSPLDFRDSEATSLTNLKKGYAADTAELEISLAASDKKLADVEHHIQASEHKKTPGTSWRSKSTDLRLN